MTPASGIVACNVPDASTVMSASDTKDWDDVVKVTP
jgi:hypothetical protein